MTAKLGFSRRLAVLTQNRIVRRTTLVHPDSTHHSVPKDPADSPILTAAVFCGADYLVTNDAHLIALNSYRGLRIISMDDYMRLLAQNGLLAD